MRQGEGETRRHGEPASGHVGPPSGVEPGPEGEPASGPERPTARRGKRGAIVRGTMFEVQGSTPTSNLEPQVSNGVRGEAAGIDTKYRAGYGYPRRESVLRSHKGETGGTGKLF